MTASTAEPRPGDLWVANTGNGPIAKAIRGLTDSPVNHAGGYLPDGLIWEAQPWGPKVKGQPRTHGLRVGPNYYPDGMLIPVPMPLDVTQRQQVAAVALAFRGMKYNFLDIAVLGLNRTLHVPLTDALRRYLANPGHLMCSQADDLVMQAVGVHLFTDGRLAGDVTPGDLYDLRTKYV